MSSAAARDIELKELQEWCKGRMPSYQIPSALLVQEEIPKNAMGKVMKKNLVHLFNKG
jgi:malonyl-CoA/methylmalonyl-CoA synthetase